MLLTRKTSTLKGFFSARSIETFDVVLDSIKYGDYDFFHPVIARNIEKTSSDKKKRNWLSRLLEKEGLENAYAIKTRKGEPCLVANGVYAIDNDQYREFPLCVARLKFLVKFDGDVISDKNLFRDGVIAKPSYIYDVYEQVDIPKSKFMNLDRKRVEMLLSPRDVNKLR